MNRQWESDRLLIRRFREDDLDALFELQGDAEATRFIGGPWTLEKTRATLAKIVANDQATELEWHAVERRADGAVIGVCWLGRLNSRWDANLGAGHIELGYRYARRFWGNGYATEAGARMLRRGFEELNLPQIVAIVDVRNVASDRVIQKLAMQHRKTFEQDGLTIKFYTLDRSPMPP